MSSKEETELKAGHPPAVKAGGMRVARHRTSSGPEKETMTKEEQEEYGAEQSEVNTHNQEVLVSGVMGKGDKDFKPEAVKQYHEKPVPSKSKSHNPSPHNIHQPR